MCLLYFPDISHTEITKKSSLFFSFPGAEAPDPSPPDPTPGLLSPTPAFPNPPDPTLTYVSSVTCNITFLSCCSSIGLFIKYFTPFF